MKAFSVLFCCLLLFTGCGPTNIDKLEQNNAATLMAPADVLTLVDGNTLFVQSFEEDSYMYFDHSGKLFAKDIYNNKDKGKWDVSEDGELCVRMKSWWYGDLRCFQVLVSADNSLHLANSSGILQYSARQYPGDAKSLFQVVKGKKKSFRRSLRTANQPGPAAETVVESTSTDSAEESSPVVEDTPGYSAPKPQDLRSTVKWMARDCPGCNLAETDLKKADLVAANLAGANLRGATLKMSNLRRANLEGANLEGANLSYANLPGANLKNAHLAGANLQGANLIRADLSGADLDGADLTDALLEGVRGLQRR